MSVILSVTTMALLACSTADPEVPRPVVLATEPVDQAPLPASAAPEVDRPMPDEPSSPGESSLPGEQVSAGPTTAASAGAGSPALPAPTGEVCTGQGCETTTITVRPGESLHLLASLASVTPEELASLNGMEVTDPLVAGARIAVPVGPLGPDGLDEARRAAARERLDRYVAARGGEVGRTLRQVRTGETAWSIIHDDADIPMWVLAACNPDVDLDRLRAGDLLVIPLFGDRLAEAGPAGAAGTGMPGEGSPARSTDVAVVAEVSSASR
ncbi:MAG: LysM domain-containing protein [Deltaproteobacteria bacterium]|nr:MAG: LysM domain-containing protein [Deltaproteobacteria bacterium]